jgi:N6-adenosine-specific RNA methylase IME4
MLRRNLRFRTILADPPWRFSHRTGKVAPEYGRHHRYRTLRLDEIAEMPVGDWTLPNAHLYLWCPNALLPQGLSVMQHWGFSYKTNIIWLKTCSDGRPDRRGVGFYFRNATEVLLFGTKGRLRTKSPARSLANVLLCPRREHSRKPDGIYDLVERCSYGPYLELFARTRKSGWSQFGDELGKFTISDLPSRAA